jgi:hypothetical protein
MSSSPPARPSHAAQRARHQLRKSRALCDQARYTLQRAYVMVERSDLRLDATLALVSRGPQRHPEKVSGARGHYRRDQGGAERLER